MGVASCGSSIIFARDCGISMAVSTVLFWAQWAVSPSDRNLIYILTNVKASMHLLAISPLSDSEWC